MTKTVDGKRIRRFRYREFYQLLAYTDDADLNRELAAWEHFYNYDRPHSAFAGQTSYEAMKV